MYSYLKHVKGCLITQTNWRASDSWKMSVAAYKNAASVFNKIQDHEDFSDVFKKSSFGQVLRQAELDVVGINIEEKKIYMVEVAFHENGLQYGSKSATKDRVCKKLLRAYLVGLCYFPDFSYEILFASPKVNPATDAMIQGYFSVLGGAFGGGKVNFRYLANNGFKNDVLIPTLLASQSDSDSSELFLRVVKMLELFNLICGNILNANSGGKPKDSLQQDIQRVGMETFVDYYPLFKNTSYTDQEIKDTMRSEHPEWTDNTINTKVSVGRKIIKEGKGEEALERILQSKKTEAEMREKASSLLE